MSQPVAETAPKPDSPRSEPIDQLVETEHTVTIAGRQIHYTVTAGTIILREEAEKKGEASGESEGEKARASVFFIAYTRTDADDAARRPVMFSFNGGPGSSSVWLHLGILGPRRVDLGEKGDLPPPPSGSIRCAWRAAWNRPRPGPASIATWPTASPTASARRPRSS